MPYIPQKNRGKYHSSIETILDIINVSDVYLRGEFFGYFVNNLVKVFLKQQSENLMFQNIKFDIQKKILDDKVSEIGICFNFLDPLLGAGELNYVISAIYWGLLGDYKNFSNANYGTRAYLNGIIDQILIQLDKDDISRTNLIVRGVLDHIKHETYLRKTTIYEQKKIDENDHMYDSNGILI